VSPHWRDEVAIYLAPRKLALVRRARGFERRVVASTELALAVPTGGSADFRPVIALLSDVLAEPTWHRAAARAVVADHAWARYAVVAWPPARLDAAARLAHARFVLGDAWGEAVADWEVSLADAPPGRPCVACAMPPALRGALEEALAPARLSLSSLQPQLVAAFNGWRDRLPAEDTWFVTVDDGALAAAHLAGGAWDRVHLARLAPDWTVELDRLQAFGRLTGTAGGRGRMFVDGPAWMRRAAADRPGIEWLEQGDGAQTHVSALLRRMCA
jgi:hypothetical protein